MGKDSIVARCVKQLTKHTGTVLDLAITVPRFKHLTSHLVSASMDRTVMVWEIPKAVVEDNVRWREYEYILIPIPTNRDHIHSSVLAYRLYQHAFAACVEFLTTLHEICIHVCA